MLQLPVKDELQTSYPRVRLLDGSCLTWGSMKQAYQKKAPYWIKHPKLADLETENRLGTTETKRRILWGTEKKILRENYDDSNQTL